jgi:hypothetical protein
MEARSPARSARPAERGAYLQNGERLVRVAGRLGEQVLVEDCRTLDVTLMRPTMLSELGFKVLRR